jgi:hypothetical protein
MIIIRHLTKQAQDNEQCVRTWVTFAWENDLLIRASPRNSRPFFSLGRIFTWSAIYVSMYMLTGNTHLVRGFTVKINLQKLKFAGILSVVLVDLLLID